MKIIRVIGACVSALAVVALMVLVLMSSGILVIPLVLWESLRSIPKRGPTAWISLYFLVVLPLSMLVGGGVVRLVSSHGKGSDSDWIQMLVTFICACLGATALYFWLWR